MIVHGYFALAKDLQNDFGNFLDLMEKSIPDLFQNSKQLTLDEIKQKLLNDPMSLTKLPEQKTPPTVLHSKWKVEFISL